MAIGAKVTLVIYVLTTTNVLAATTPELLSQEHSQANSSHLLSNDRYATTTTATTTTTTTISTTITASTTTNTSINGNAKTTCAKASASAATPSDFFDTDILATSFASRYTPNIYNKQQNSDNETYYEFEAQVAAMFSCSSLNQATAGLVDSQDQDQDQDKSQSQSQSQNQNSASGLSIDLGLAKHAIELATNDAALRYPRVKLNVTFAVAPDVCADRKAIGLAADMFYAKKASFFVGAGCSDSLEFIGQLASYWNAPLCSTGYLPEIIARRFKRQTLIQMSLSHQSVGAMLLELLQRYNWRHLVIVTDEEDSLHASLRDGLLEFFRALYSNSYASTNTFDTTFATARSPSVLFSSTLAPEMLVSQTNAWHQRQPYHYKPEHQVETELNTDTQSGRQDEVEQEEGELELESELDAMQGRQTNSYNNNHIKKPYFINVTEKNFGHSSKRKRIDFEKVMLEAAQSSRIMLLLARAETVVKLLVAAKSAEMSKGQFVFLVHELFEAQDSRLNSPIQPVISNSTSTTNYLANHNQNQNQNQNNKHKHKHKQRHRYKQQQGQRQPEVAKQTQTFSITDRLNDPALRTALGGDLGADELLMSPTALAATSNSSTSKYEAEVYSPVMKISVKLASTEQFNSFRRKLASLAGIRGKQSLRDIYAINAAGLVYDCVTLYAAKVNEILARRKRGDKVHVQVDGKTIFKLSANQTFRDGLTGDLVLNEAGQRVLDLTLNDFSPFKLDFKPLAHFASGNLSFVANEAPFWTLRNLPTPVSDPRCKLTELNCEPSSLESLAYFSPTNVHTFQGHMNLSSHSSNVVLGVWLVLGGVVCAVASSSLVACFVYHKLRVESELLNLWWSINYNDIVFDDDDYEGLATIGADGCKQSLSSLAPSNESLANATTITNTTSPKDQQQTLHGSPASYSLGANFKSYAPTSQAPRNKTPPPHLMTTAASREDFRSSSSLSSLKNATYVGKKQQNSTSTITTSSTKNQTSPASSKRAANRSVIKEQASQQCAALHNKTKLRLGAILNTTSNNKSSNAFSTSKNSQESSYPTKVGLYKASRVAVKHLRVSSLSINRQLLVELRQVRDLTHENLVKFIGLCADEPNIALVLELCTRGNLHVLLQNDSIRLDWPFRHSIINDIVEGLAHLHSSPIAYHGRLKSSNCVIDSRFVVKLTDFGLPTLIKAIECERIERRDAAMAAAAAEYISSSNNIATNNNNTNNTSSNNNNNSTNNNNSSNNNSNNSNSNNNNNNSNTNDSSEAQTIAANDASAAEAAEKTEDFCKLLLWTAPEHLRTKYPLASGSQKGDIYSLGIVLQEIITRCGPFECEPIALCTPQPSCSPLGARFHGQQPQQVQHTQLQSLAPPPANYYSQANVNMHQQQQQRQLQLQLQPVLVQHKQRLEAQEIVNLVRMGLSPPFRPYFRPDVVGSQVHSAASNEFNVSGLVQLVQQCWHESAALRPPISTVKAQLKRLRHSSGQLAGSANLMDNLLQRMERYTDNLESLVEQKTAELMAEKKRSEELLYEMLPRFVVEQLKYGHCVTPEAYDAVTVCFSDIKDFTAIAAQSSPLEVVNLLNKLYTEFDNCIAQYDVYKVETIGDAYMVVSGLPVRNGDLHAREIAQMSLGMLQLIKRFKIVHLPHVTLQLRIGVHSGPCASGVVGTKMFRYCLFGDTVNTASRMESHGEPMKIHISEDTAQILSKFGNEFQVQQRGFVDIKGKGTMKTFWLLGSNLMKDINLQTNDKDVVK